MPLLVAISVLSACVIGYEILLMRLFSIIQWHNFAYMIISLALLGYGAAGTFIALFRDRLLARFRAVFAAAAATFGIAAPAAFALAQLLPFNPLELVWDIRQQLYLLQLYFLLAIPFFCAAICIGLAFARFGDRIEVIYRCDLLGAGAGALGIIVVLFALPPADALRLIGAGGLLAAALTCLERPVRRGAAAALAAAGVVSFFLWPEAALAPRPSPYKGLMQALQVPGTRVIEQRTSPLGVLTVVESPKVPFRHAPGLSLHARAPIPPQLAVFTDGDSMTAITRYDGRESVAYLDAQSAALPYHLLDRPRVLVLGTGGGADVLRALAHRARSIDAVELDPQMADIVGRSRADFAGRILEMPGVRAHVAEARGFVARSDKRFDLIQLALLDSFAASAAGLYALTATTLYTVEALETYLARLAPGGMLAITRWLKLPPRDSIRMFATAVTALERLGVADPGNRLALVRSWNTATLLVKNGVFSPADIGAIRSFSQALGFDVAWFPGITAAHVNRHNVLPRPYLFEAATALLGPQRDAFIRDYKFRIAPATDDRPYFFHFFRWRTLPEFLARRGAGGLQQLEWGYLVLVATLAQAALVSIVLVLLPLRVLARRRAATAERRPFARTVVYFMALGFAFLFIEIAFMQRFTLFLAHPLYAVAVVLAAFLFFAGLGSGFSARLGVIRRLPLAPITIAVSGIVVVALTYLVVLPSLFDWLRPLSQTARVAVSVGLIAPLAFCMGMPFPLGLRRLAEGAPALVPWAWGINGCASVMSAVLATLAAIHIGFTAVVGMAVALYVLAAWVFRDGAARSGP